MTLLAAVVSLALGAAEASPATAVLVARRTAVTPAEGQALAVACSNLLKEAGVAIAVDPDTALKQLARVSVKDTATCNGKKACLAELGRQLKLDYVVLLSAATVDAETSVGLELLKVADEAVVAKDSLLVPRKGKPDAELVSGFAAKVKEVFAPAPATPDVPPVKPDAPKVAELTPKPAELPPPPPPPEPAPSKVVPYTLGGLGAAALVASGAMLAAGLSMRGSLTQGEVGADGRVRSALTGAQAQTVNGNSSLLLGGAAGAAVVGLGLGAAAFFTW